jgi:N-carbamoylputrescine amidase
MQSSDDSNANMPKAVDMTRDAIAKGADVICLPELFCSRYFCQSEDDAHYGLAKAVRGPSTDALVELVRCVDVVIRVSVFEWQATA